MHGELLRRSLWAQAGCRWGRPSCWPMRQGTSPAHRAAIEKADGADTTITTHFSGRPARSIRNKMTDLEVNSPDEIAPFPTQLSVAAPLRQHSVEKGTGDFIPLWAGQAVGLCRPGSAAQLVEGLVDEALEIMGH